MTDLLIGMSTGAFAGGKGDVVFRNGGGGVFRGTEMRHSRSEDLLGPPTNRTPSPLMTTASEDDLVASSALRECSSPCSPCPIPCSLMPRAPGALADRVDPEDSIRDIVTENDLYRYVLFKRHYDKYMALAAKYEEARGLAYDLEERYHEVKAERDQLEQTMSMLEKRLESCEADMKDKDEELFIQFERSASLEDELERVKINRDSCLESRKRLEREQASTLRQLQLQSTQNELTKRTLERARQEVIRQATVIRAERDSLERENEVLKEKLRIEHIELGDERRRREEGVAALSHEATVLRHAARHLRAAAVHATSCRRRRRCSVCIYAKRTFADTDDYRNDFIELERAIKKGSTSSLYNGKLFKCLQAPLHDIRTWLRPDTPAALPPLRTSSPLDREIGYIDDSSSGSEDEAYSNTPGNEVSLASTNSSAPPTARAFSSDSGFSSETGDRRSRSYECGGSSRKISESSISEESQRATSGFSRSRWTSSFRKLLGRKSKNKNTAVQS